jgi:hypothetical protein
VSDQRLVVVGMNNPASRDPRAALWPDPPGCAGHRLWEMARARTGISQSEWLVLTDRRNLCVGDWSHSAARRQAAAWHDELRGRTVLQLGVSVMCAMRVEGDTLRRPLEWHPTRDWVDIPHPSGLCRSYNNSVVRTAVEILLAELVEMHREQ